MCECVQLILKKVGGVCAHNYDNSVNMLVGYTCTHPPTHTNTSFDLLPGKCCLGHTHTLGLSQNLS